jgi:hypothetical protein
MGGGCFTAVTWSAPFYDLWLTVFISSHRAATERTGRAGRITAARLRRTPPTPTFPKEIAMSARRRRIAAAIVLVAATTVLTPALASAATPAAHAAAVNGTKGNGLTISNGSPYVVMDGTTVDFHTDVRDLAWNPAGTKAAYIDSYGDLETANANGTGRDIIAIHPAGAVFSHPTWQVATADHLDGLPAKNNVIFVAATKGVDRLETTSATAHFGKPTLLALAHGSGDKVTPNPLTANNWPNSGGSIGTIVYDNTGNGEVYLRDDNVRQQGGAVTEGSEPALAPNSNWSEEMVFVRSVAGHDHIFEGQYETVGNETLFAVRDLTPHATTNYTEPTFSANGQTIAFRGGDGTYTLPVSGSHTPVRTSTYTGLAAYRG